MPCCYFELNCSLLNITRLWCNESFGNLVKMHPDDVVGTQMTLEANNELGGLISSLVSMNGVRPLIICSPSFLFGVTSEEETTTNKEYMLTIHFDEYGKSADIRRYVCYTSSHIQEEAEKLVAEREEHLLMLNTIFENHSIIMGIMISNS